MAYNALKRIFGETKLELKLLFLFGVGLLVIVATAFYWYGLSTRSMVYEKNQEAGRLHVDQYLLETHFQEMELKKVDRERLAMLEPTPDEEREQRQERDSWIGALSKDFVTSNYKIKLIDPWPPTASSGTAEKDEDNGPKDSFEKEQCDKYLASAPQHAEDAETVEFTPHFNNDNTEYEYFQPIYVKNSCLLCHAANPAGSGFDAIGSGVPFARRPMAPGRGGWQAGQLMAIAKVTIPNQTTQQRLNFYSAVAWTFAISTAFLGMLTSYAIIRYVIVKPLRHLRDVSDAVTRGETALRAEIRTGDEFEQLATAFNRMLRTLITIQEELRQANVSLDGKVDELAQVNVRLYEMNQIKSDFLATMSHELRTPLNSILGFSDVLAGIESMDEKQKRYVQHIRKSGKTLLEMVNNILDLAKMESGKMEVRPAEFRLQQIVAAQADMARPLAERKNIDLEIDVDPDLPPLLQDQGRVQQIVNNLLSNAIKFTPEGGRVTVAAARDADDSLLLRVIDTGVGIAEEDQQAIFEKFRQGTMSVPTGDIMTREFSGSGLGLSIVKELCKLLGGEVSVASELGKGSTFTVRLPWTLQEAARTASGGVEDLEPLAAR